MPIEPPRARYQQVADELRVAIRRGDFAPGSALPSQPELARRFGLNQTTINRAVAILQAEGLVRIERGRGAFVLPLAAVTRIRRASRGPREESAFAESVRAVGLEPRTELDPVTVMSPPIQIAHQLDMDEGDEVVVRRRRMYASDHPVQLATSYIPISVAGDTSIAELDVGPTGLYERLAERGNRPARFIEEIEVRQPTPEEEAFLSVSPPQSVLAILRTVYDKDGAPIEATLNALTSSNWRLSYEWTTS